MIFVDTSVWVQALRRGTSDEAGVLRTLLDADEVALPLPVRIELLSGVSAEQRAALTRALAALPVARPTDETWTQVEQWGEAAARAGEHFALTDLMIAALTREAGGLVWSLDGDFKRMADLGFVQHS
jgi:predicted nucleic acid-binding protein